MPQFLGFNYATPITIESVSVDIVSESANLKIFNVSKDAQRWDLRITLVGGIDDNLYGEFIAHYLKNGISSAFNIEIPQNPSVLTAYSKGAGAIQSSAAGALGATSINVDSTTAFNLPTGLFFRFSNHNKVYVVTTQRVGDGSLEFSPPLHTAVPDNTSLVTEDVMINVVHNRSNREFSYTRGVIQRITASFREFL